MIRQLALTVTLQKSLTCPLMGAAQSRASPYRMAFERDSERREYFRLWQHGRRGSFSRALFK